jgi:hypothetical protein
MKISKDSSFSGRHLNLEPPDYETGDFNHLIATFGESGIKRFLILINLLFSSVRKEKAVHEN